jgi:hypothetical protein
MKVAVLLLLTLALSLMARASSKAAEEIQVVASESTSEGAMLSVTAVSVHAIFPDGEHVSLWCSNWERHCLVLKPGTYEAEVGEKDVWIHVGDSKVKFGDSGSGSPEAGKHPRKIKYKVSGNW